MGGNMLPCGYTLYEGFLITTSVDSPGNITQPLRLDTAMFGQSCSTDLHERYRHPLEKLPVCIYLLPVLVIPSA